MPTALSVGTTTFRAVEINETLSRTGFDSLTVVLKGAASGLATELANWTRGKTYPGYPNMFLETRDSRDRGPVAEITLNFQGFLSSSPGTSDVIDISDSISRQAVTLTTDADENVSFSFYAQVTTTRWIYRGQFMPKQPKYPGVVPSTIPTNILFQPDPPNFEGSISGQYKANGRMSQFDRQRLAPGVWGVIESWEVLIEPIQEIA